MAEPILVADLGACTTSAALVSGDQVRLVREPVTGGALWHSCVCIDGDGYAVGEAAERRRRVRPGGYRDGLPPPTDPDAVAPHVAHLIALRAAATSGENAGEIARLLLAAPAGYGVPDPRRDALIAAGERAGFTDVELVNDSVAAVLDAAVVAPFEPGALVLTCDLGATFSTALLEVRDGVPTQLAQETSAGGRELDRLLLDAVCAEPWLEPLLAAPGDAGLRTQQDVAGFVRALKHRLADEPEVIDRLGPFAPPVRLTRDWLRLLADSALRWVVASCRSLLARVGRGPADVAGVVLLGGGSRLPGVAPILQSGLMRPVRWAAEPDLAVVRGAARWAAAAGTRTVPAGRPRWRIEGLNWAIPQGDARLEQWLVAAGEAYPAGALLARVRTHDDRVLDLTAGAEGTLLGQAVRPGDAVAAGHVLARARSAASMAEDPPAKRHELRVHGDWLLTPDRRLLVECEETGRRVRLRAIGSGRVVREFRPEPSASGHGRVFVRPGGALALLAWSEQGEFRLWDVDSGELLVTISDAPGRVLVNEETWRLAVAGASRVSAGRYRRAITTVWDLDTGRRLERTTDDDWARRHTGYTDRSAADGFAEAARSPDGRLLAGALSQEGSTALALRDAQTDEQVFRVEHRAEEHLRTAFSADGRYLLANWERPDQSQVDVYEI